MLDPADITRRLHLGEDGRWEFKQIAFGCSDHRRAITAPGRRCHGLRGAQHARRGVQGSGAHGPPAVQRGSAVRGPGQRRGAPGLFPARQPHPPVHVRRSPGDRLSGRPAQQPDHRRDGGPPVDPERSHCVGARACPGRRYSRLRAAAVLHGTSRRRCSHHLPRDAGAVRTVAELSSARRFQPAAGSPGSADGSIPSKTPSTEAISTPRTSPSTGERRSPCISGSERRCDSPTRKGPRWRCASWPSSGARRCSNTVSQVPDMKDGRRAIVADRCLEMPRRAHGPWCDSSGVMGGVAIGSQWTQGTAAGPIRPHP